MDAQYAKTLAEQAQKIEENGNAAVIALASLWLSVPEQYRDEVWSLQHQVSILSRMASLKVEKKAKAFGYESPL